MRLLYQLVVSAKRGFYMAQEKTWIEVATEMFYEYREEAESYELKELALLSAGKAVALSELLEKYGAKPKVD